MVSSVSVVDADGPVRLLRSVAEPCLPAGVAEDMERQHRERPAWTQAAWQEATLRPDVRALLWHPAGPGLAASLTHLEPAFPCPLPHAGEHPPGRPAPGHEPGWPCACQVIVAAAWEACAAWVAAGAARSLVQAVGPKPRHHVAGSGAGVIHDPAREELAAALRWSPGAMGNRIGAARALLEHPPVVGLVATGAITPWAGRLITDQLVGLELAQAQQVVAEVVRRVDERLRSGRRPWHSAEVSRQARAARLRICPEQEQALRVRAFAQRRVVVHPGRDGMATLIADLAEVDARRIHRRLTAMAEGLEAAACADGGTEPRTRDQLRADTLVDLILADDCRQGAHPGEQRPVAADGSGSCPAPADSQPDLAAPRPSGVGSSPAPSILARPEISVIVPLQVLLGLCDDPAEVPGLGPIPAEIARALAADGTWRAWVSDAAGAITATGSRGYVPTEAVARLVRAREPHCRFPGCRQPARRCDLDHAIPWPRGSTSPANLGPLCRRHHNLKTHAGWQLVPGDDGGSRTIARVSGPGLMAVPEPSGDPATEQFDSEATDRGPAISQESAGWTWLSPAGLRISDGPPPPF